MVEEHRGFTVTNVAQRYEKSKALGRGYEPRPPARALFGDTGGSGFLVPSLSALLCLREHRPKLLRIPRCDRSDDPIERETQPLEGRR